jgi:NodT family efflux transporter outer membrane factor (OMF) lipoprotein
MNVRYRLLASLVACLGLAGCHPGPDYVRPKVDVPPAFKEAGQWKPAAGQALPADTAWWKVFADATLDTLEAQVEVNNQNLKAVAAQYRAAQAALQSAKSPQLPGVSASLSDSRGSASTTPSSALGVSANWEIDIWGRIRRNVESADAKLAASAADLAAARLSTQALLVQTYMQLRAADVQIDLYRRSAEAYARFLAMTRNRLAAGVASQLDVAQAETQLHGAEAQSLDLQTQRAQLEHAIATLVGKMPADLTLPPDARLPAVPQAPALIPSTLLENRPDIVAAERQVAAANAQIGVADAAYFPVLNLSGGLGYRGNSFANLLSAPNRFWSLGPALAMTVFDGGARSAAVSQATAATDQAVAAYRQAVLTAFQEVEDNLSASRLLEQERAAQAGALAAARRAREIAENQYQAGIVNALNVITAQTAELSATAASVSIDSRRLQAIVLLLKNTNGMTPLIAAQARH